MGMPPPLPPRYRLEVRLGRDQDVEEWLASDLTLDRPVLVRVVGPEAEPHRQERFLGKVRSAARVSHIHLAEVYDAEQAEGTAYSVTEWTGGISLANRIAAGETPSIPEFLSNAAGLADGLAALHEEGIVHGCIDASAVGYAGAHPAKLGGFGRSSQTWSAVADVQALGSALETALTGRPAGEIAPSQMIDDLPAAVDDALRQARLGEINSRRLSELIRSIPYAPPPRPEARWSWRWLIPPRGWRRRPSFCCIWARSCNRKRVRRPSPPNWPFPGWRRRRLAPPPSLPPSPPPRRPPPPPPPLRRPPPRWKCAKPWYTTRWATAPKTPPG